MNNLPKISIIIPTLNSIKTLPLCLESIQKQDYPADKIEIILGDGGSTDGTIELAQKYGAAIVNNPLKTGESGKAVAIKKSNGEIIALIDSDNILPDHQWLLKMVDPFNDPEIILCEPWEYTYRQSDPWLTRYFALLGMNDPLCLFLGNYDRRGILSASWTGLKVDQVDKQQYLEVTLERLPIPTIGANGTMIRKSSLPKLGDYYNDIDIPVQMIRNNEKIKIAKVKIGIVHTFVEDDPRKFFKKQIRRVNDWWFHADTGGRETAKQMGYIIKGALEMGLSCIFVLPILWQTIYGYRKSRDWAWFFHPIACYSTLIIYSYGFLKSRITKAESDRKNWKQ